MAKCRSVNGKYFIIYCPICEKPATAVFAADDVENGTVDPKQMMAVCLSCDVDCEVFEERIN